MKIQSGEPKRLAIFAFYDREGIADEYVFYYLKCLKKCISKLLVICNGEVTQASEARLRECADEFIKRENKGFDITAYKLGLQHYGYDALADYDEVVVCNATMFGPFYPFEEMFDAMAERDVDFWGLTCFHEVPFDPFGTIVYGHIPKHVQSFFQVYRSSLIKSREFQKHWDEMPQIHSYEEAIGFHEAIFTRKFSEMGFQWDSYVDSSDLEGYTYDPLRDFPKYLLEEKRCPLLKRRSFFHDYTESLTRSGGEALREALVYAKENLDYDFSMIWENILRLENQADLKKRMHLNYVLSSKIRKKRQDTIKRIALQMHIYYEDQAEFCRKYAESMPEGTDVFITVPNEEKRKHAAEVFDGFPYHYEIRVIGNRGRDVGSLLTGIKDVVMNYDLLCRVHDKKVYQVKPMSLGASWAYKCFDNLLKNKVFVENVIATFEENPYLGMLMPPIPNHGPYYPITGKGEWGENYPMVHDLAEMLHLKVNMSEEKEPTAPLGSMFWVRPKALRSLFAHDWKYEEYPKEPIKDDATILHAIERVYPFCVQNDGYYSAWLMTDAYAAVELDNWQYMNQKLENAEREIAGARDHRETLEVIKQLQG